MAHEMHPHCTIIIIIVTNNNTITIIIGTLVHLLAIDLLPLG